MAEPGDPKALEAQEPDHDSHVGFVSPASLTGRPAPRREPAPPSPFERSPSETVRAAAGPRPAAPMSLYAVYVLILLAVPTLGVAAAIALLAVGRREAPEEPFAGSHFVYQQRTLWIAAIGALLGAVLVVVNVGVFVLFAAAVWILARGAFGVLKLKAGQPVPNPRGWLF